MSKNKISAFTIFNYALFIIVALICVLPILLILVNAISSEADLKSIGFAIIPLHPTLNAFKMLFRDPSGLLFSLGASIFYAVFGSLITIVFEAMLGYTLTRDYFVFKKSCNILLTITMFFAAGTIPTYIVYTQIYHLNDNMLVYLIPTIGAFNVFVFRSFFNQIPQSLIESANLDGAKDMQILSKIIVPLSMPILVSQFFMRMTGAWQNYTTSMYYISDSRMYTLEYYIQVLLKDASLMTQNLELMGIPSNTIPTLSMRFAVVFCTVIPMIVVFPLCQKYFSKGALVGSVKE